jgi:short-subunit dehydrogenase
MKLKKLDQQVMVITGATSGIGLATARKAAKAGAKLVLAARNEEALKWVVGELAHEGGEATHVVADVGDEKQVRRIALAELQRFGGFDTWVNNAGISIYGRTEEVQREDQRRLFDTNFWGVVHGSMVALEHLRERGGALINIGSEVSDVPLPLQGIYAASKHAVKGFTDSLRIELEQDDVPVSVTLIKPAAIDTMYVAHARNYLKVEPSLPPPVYAPALVADAILYAAQFPQRDMYVGGAAKLASAMGRVAPRFLDRFLGGVSMRQQQTSTPAQNRADALYAPAEDLKESQGLDRRVHRVSPYTRAAMHPKTTTALLIGAGLAIAALWRAKPGRLRFRFR